ncbi:MAG: amidohydrolase [Oscillospiraceae bacterium]|nr:amidohydrolase [Oscillospiraceae bacterium]
MLIEHRRALHRLAEVGWELPETVAYLRSVLEKLPCKLFSPVPMALCAWFDFGKKDTVAFRADMDGLPIAESTGLPFASLHPGMMHACGHDGHMAIALALAEELANRQDAESNVLLIFEPAEETVGGAKPICDTGLLKDYGVQAVYGLHLWPELPLHTIGSRPGAMMARSCELTVTVSGSSAHIARWQEAKDALYAASCLLQEFYALAKDQPCLLRFGQLEAGQVRNAVADQACLKGTFRCFDDELYERLLGQMQELGRRITALTGCDIQIHCTTGYPPVTNDPALYARAKRLLTIEEVAPTYITEDFSQYQREVPGVFFWLGTGGTGLHDPAFDFDEAVLGTGLSLFLSLL